VRGQEVIGRSPPEVVVKKLLLLAIAGAGAFAIWRKMESDKAEQDLWAQATDSV
jgi:hypothetical protein